MAKRLPEGIAQTRGSVARYIDPEWFELDVPVEERTGFELRAGEDFPVDLDVAKVRNAIRNYGIRNGFKAHTFKLPGVPVEEAFGVKGGVPVEVDESELAEATA